MGCCGKNEQEPIELIDQNGAPNQSGKYGKFFFLNRYYTDSYMMIVCN